MVLAGGVCQIREFKGKSGKRVLPINFREESRNLTNSRVNNGYRLPFLLEEIDFPVC